MTVHVAADQAELERAVELLKANGFVAYRKTPRSARSDTSKQRLWLCRWGTMTALVWAVEDLIAVERIRHRVYDRYATLDEVRRAPVVVSGEITVREATAADLVQFEEAGGKVPA